MTIADLGLYEMVHPGSLDALCALVSERQTRGQATVLLAGGTDWVVEQEMRGPVPEGQTLPVVADVSRLGELRGISVDRGVMRGRLMGLRRALSISVGTESLRKETPPRGISCYQR